MAKKAEYLLSSFARHRLCIGLYNANLLSKLESFFFTYCCSMLGEIMWRALQRDASVEF